MPETILCVDIGNSHTTLGLAENGGIEATWEIATGAIGTADQLAATVDSLLALHGLGLRMLQAVAISSVVPPALACWKSMCDRYLAGNMTDVHPLAVSKVAISYPRPEEVGTDRLVNASAAWRRYGSAAIVVDLGTATTFDCISSRGEYMGGAIAPGLASSMKCLATSTARLPAVSFPEGKASPLGRNTTEAIQAGLLYGFAGLVDRLVEELSAVLDQPPRVLATGGLARTIAPYSRSVQEVVPNLALEGILHLYRNSGA